MSNNIKSGEEMLTQSELKSLFHYCEESGIFTRIKTTSSRAIAGDIAGYVDSAGYLQIRIGKTLHRAHRLAWLYVYGYFPAHHVDHINRNPSDNRIANLREATASENLRNTAVPVSNTSGYKGVTFSKAANKWMARCTVNRKDNYLGLFATAELASAAYEEFAKNAHGDFYLKEKAAA